MRKFNQGYSLVFLAIIIVALLAVMWAHARVQGTYQARVEEMAHYTVDDWIAFFRLEELLGEPKVTPIPFEELFPPTPSPTTPGRAEASS
ncbi:MAG: hypothetical protein D6791_16915 [Chloroflexi bacterium]|nr:MAG: hypothetical protein D6791_16915 [Chloroflexota bacterium]